MPLEVKSVACEQCGGSVSFSDGQKFTECYWCRASLKMVETPEGLSSIVSRVERNTEQLEIQNRQLQQLATDLYGGTRPIAFYEGRLEQTQRLIRRRRKSQDQFHRLAMATVLWLGATVFVLALLETASWIPRI